LAVANWRPGTFACHGSFARVQVEAGGTAPFAGGDLGAVLPGFPKAKLVLP